jgi:hypothetical protein
MVRWRNPRLRPCPLRRPRRCARVGFPLYLTCNITGRPDPCLANHYDPCCAAVCRWLLLCLLKTIANLAIVQILMPCSYLCNLCLLCTAIVCGV